MDIRHDIRKTSPPLICPSLLAADFSALGQEIAKVKTADALHLDIMDGHFVPNISYGPGLVKALRPFWDKPFDVHLMVENPAKWVAPFVAAGADAISFHVEATAHAHRLLQLIHAQGCLAGISLNPGTSVEQIEPLLPFVDQVLIMTVNPGFGGQAYIPEMEAKISRLSQLAANLNRPILIQVDGGIKEENIGQAARAGASYFVAGTAIFHAADPAATIRAMRQAAGVGASSCGKV